MTDERSTEPAVLDPLALERLAQLDPSGRSALVRRVLATFRSSLARLGAQIGAADAASDRPAMRLAAHTLKSSSASVGALALSKLCAELEQAARLEQGAEIPALVQRLLAEAERVDQAVGRLIAD